MAKELLIVILLFAIALLVNEVIGNQFESVYEAGESEGFKGGYRLGVGQCPKVSGRPE